MAYPLYKISIMIALCLDWNLLYNRFFFWFLWVKTARISRGLWSRVCLWSNVYRSWQFSVWSTWKLLRVHWNLTELAVWTLQWNLLLKSKFLLAVLWAHFLFLYSIGYLHLLWFLAVQFINMPMVMIGYGPLYFLMLAFFELCLLLLPIVFTIWLQAIGSFLFLTIWLHTL